MDRRERDLRDSSQRLGRNDPGAASFAHGTRIFCIGSIFPWSAHGTRVSVLSGECLLALARCCIAVCSLDSYTSEGPKSPVVLTWYSWPHQIHTNDFVPSVGTLFAKNAAANYSTIPRTVGAARCDAPAALPHGPTMRYESN